MWSRMKLPPGRSSWVPEHEPHTLQQVAGLNARLESNKEEEETPNPKP
jgi:hypothetical protein